MYNKKINEKNMCTPHNAHVHRTKLEEEDKKLKGAMYNKRTMKKIVIKRADKHIGCSTYLS